MPIYVGLVCERGRNRKDRRILLLVTDGRHPKDGLTAPTFRVHPRHGSGVFLRK